MAFTQGDLIKSVSRPEVYLIDAGKRRWLPDPSTLLSVGSWEQVQVVSDAEIDAVPLGNPVPSVLGQRVFSDGTLVKGSGSETYLIEEGRRRWIPDPETFTALGLDSNKINVISDTELNLIPLGPQVPHTMRIPISLFTDLKYNHYQQSTANFLTATGNLRVSTRTWTLTWFGGFKAVCTVVGFDSNDTVSFVATQQFGVDGTAIGTSDRTDLWTAQIDPSDAERTVRLLLTHTPGGDLWSTFIQRARSLAEVVSMVYKVGGSSATSK